MQVIRTVKDALRPFSTKRAPWWAWAYLLLQIGIFFVNFAVGREAVDPHLPGGPSRFLGPAYALATGAIWFHPVWWYNPDNAALGSWDPTRKVRGWIVGLHAFWVAMFPVVMWYGARLVDTGVVAEAHRIPVMVAWFATSFVVSVAASLYARTPSAIPTRLPCPYCGAEVSRFKRHCGRCGRERPDLWWFDRELWPGAADLPPAAIPSPHRRRN